MIKIKSAIVSTKAFSLMEVMIASAILMVMALAFSTMISESYKGQKSVAVAGEANEVFNLIGTALQNQLLCSSSFVGENVDVAIATPQSLTHITYAGSGSTVAAPIAGAVIAQPGQVIGNIKIISTNFVITGGSGSDYTADVTVAIEKSIGSAGGPIGGKDARRKFSVTLNVDTVAKKVINCALGGGGGVTTTVLVYKVTNVACGGDPINGGVTTSPTCQTVYVAGACGKFGCACSGYVNCANTKVCAGAPYTCPNIYFGKIAP